MAESGSGHDDRQQLGHPDSAPPRLRTDAMLTIIRQQMGVRREEARNKGNFNWSRRRNPSDRRFAHPPPTRFYGAAHFAHDRFTYDDFANDELPQHGCFDFGPRSPPREEQGANVRKEKRKLKRKRQKALKAASRVQEARGLVQRTDDFAAEKQQLHPEREGQKKRERPSDGDEPEFKIAKTSYDRSDSANTTELAERAAAPSVSRSAAGRQRSNSCNNVTFSQQRMRSNDDSESRTDHVRQNPKKKKAKKKKQTYLWKPEMKITAERIAFVCPVCKFHSFYRKRLEEHLESTFHKEHFKFLMEHFSKPTVEFLKGHFNERQNNVESFISHLENHRETVCQLYEDRDLTRDISMENFISKAEAAHCIACNIYIPMTHHLIQKHLSSPDHKQNCRIMMVESKDMGLNIAQGILSTRVVKKKLNLYLNDSMVTNRPDVNKEPPEAEADVMRQDQVSHDLKAIRHGQEGESSCERVINAEDVERNVKNQKRKPLCVRLMQPTETFGSREDQEGEQFCVTPIHTAESITDRRDQRGEPFCETPNRAAEVVSDSKDQEVAPFCVMPNMLNQTAESIIDTKDQEVAPFCVMPIQTPEAVIDRKDQERELFGFTPNQAAEVVGDRKDQERKPYCVVSNQAAETVSDGKDQEGEPVSVLINQAAEAVSDRKPQEAEPISEWGIDAKGGVIQPEKQEVASLSEGMIAATEAVMNGKEHQAEPMWEESNPAAATKRKEDVEERPEKQDLREFLFSLLDEEEDMEGVELGEEEQEENEYL